MKAAKKTSARLQKKLAAKTEQTIKTNATENVNTPIAAPKPLIQKKILISDILQTAKQENPSVFAQVDDKRALAIAKAIFSELNKQLEATEEGAVVLPGFGRFAIRQVAAAKSGQQNMQRKIIFRASPNKNGVVG